MRTIRSINRRLTMGLILAVVAVMLFLGVCVIDFTNSVHAWTWWWLITLGLLVWLLFLGLFELYGVLRTPLDGGTGRRPPPEEDR